MSRTKLALDHFLANLSKAKDLSNLAGTLRNQVTTAVDLNDLYRSSLVFGVSAFDRFIHELVKFGMIEIYLGSRNSTPQYDSFKIPLTYVKQANTNPNDINWLEELIQNSHSWQTFQQPDKVADAVRLISEIDLWNSVSNRMGLNSEEVKLRLKLIIDRRNKIAHEADADPSNIGSQWPIDAPLVIKALTFIEVIGNSIFSVVN